MRRHWASAALLGVILSGCGGAEEDGAFEAGSDPFPLECMEHQREMPGAVYTDESQGETTAILTMLRYYTANRDVRRFCDGKAPTEVDRAWANAYVDLGAELSNVAHLLGRPIS